MKITRPYNNEIVVVENFIDEEELKYLVSITEGISEDDWAMENENSAANWANRVYSLANHEKFDPAFFETLQERATQVVRDAYGLEDFFLTTMRMLSRAQSGEGMAMHHDQAPGDSPLSLYGLILYLNTSGKEFDGGETYYRDWPSVYSPVAGNLIMHPGDNDYSHAVRDVTGGTRYSMTAFAKG